MTQKQTCWLFGNLPFTDDTEDIIALRINYYSAGLKALIYKRTLGYLAWGIGAVIAAFTSLHCVASLTKLLTEMAEDAYVGLRYSALLFRDVGYRVISFYVKHLRKTEAVRET